MTKLIWVVILAVSMGHPARAEDEETDYLPAHGFDVTKSHQESGEIKKMTERFAKAVEARDHSEFDKLTTAEFRDQNDWKRFKRETSGALNPKLMSIHDFFLMKYKEMLLVRFSIRNQNGGRVIYLPSGTWYEIKKENGSWKMSYFWPQFDPDGGP